MAISDETRKLIFNTLKKHLETCTPPMVQGGETENHSYGLMGNKPFPYGYDKKIIPGMYFAGIAQRKDSVAFHFFPMYMNSEFDNLAPDLYKCLKGKTCFHFKKAEQINEKELELLLKKGIEAWEKAGYMK